METTDLQPSAQPAGVVNCAAYTGGVRTEVSLDAIDALLRHRDRFVWLGLYEPDETLLRRVQQQFGLHDLAIEDAYNAHQRPKLELYEDSLFVVLRTAQMPARPAAWSSARRTSSSAELRHHGAARVAEVARRGAPALRIDAAPARQRPGYVLYRRRWTSSSISTCPIVAGDRGARWRSSRK